MSFRFESLEIYQSSLQIDKSMAKIVMGLNSARYYAFADQLARASLSISNNIAEGSGSNSDKDFAHFLNISRRSVFECASMIIVFQDNGLIDQSVKSELLVELDLLSRRIQAFRHKILNP